MIFASLIAASFTFTATATGVAKGTPVEFMFAGAESDRDYETMFLIDAPIDEFCHGLEKAGVPRGEAQDIESCKLWPVGCPLTLEPSLDEFVERKPLPGGPSNPAIIYTGGARDAAEKAMRRHVRWASFAASRRRRCYPATAGRRHQSSLHQARERRPRRRPEAPRRNRRSGS